MNVPEKTCDAERLRLLLADQLSESLQAEVAEHVAQCAECLQKMESFAGNVGFWSEVESCLRTNAEQVGESSGASSSLNESRTSDESFAVDFVVDFLEPCDQPEALGRLGEYEILEVIGRGGMGVVLKGFQRELGRYVAVKVMAPHLAASGAARQRFVREARAAAAIVHPHVMPIHAVCTSARLPYLVMPCVACESLQQRIDRQGPLDVIEILRIGMQAAHGLAASHAQGLVHRDVKPANILLEKGVDRVMLTDFGLARAADDASLTRTGVVTGTPQYMSPEQSRGESIDARSDLFSLGSVLYAMCAGRPPFRAETTLAVLRRITDTQPRPIREINSAVPEWLESIVARLHDKSPEQRFASANEVAELLEQCLAHVQQPTVTPLPESLRVPVATFARTWGFRRFTHVLANVATGRMAFAAATVVAAVLLIVVVQALKQPVDSTNPRGDPGSTASASDTIDLSDDAITQESQTLNGELIELEKRTERDWDDPESSVPPQNRSKGLSQPK